MPKSDFNSKEEEICLWLYKCSIVIISQTSQTVVGKKDFRVVKRNPVICPVSLHCSTTVKLG